MLRNTVLTRSDLGEAKIEVRQPRVRVCVCVCVCVCVHAHARVVV